MAASSTADDHDLLVALVEAAANEYDLGNAVTGGDGKSGELEPLSFFSFLNCRVTDGLMSGLALVDLVLGSPQAGW